VSFLIFGDFVHHLDGQETGSGVGAKEGVGTYLLGWASAGHAGAGLHWGPERLEFDMELLL
jgi:hypothetical protein